MKKKLLIFGGGGMLGREVARLCAAYYDIYMPRSKDIDASMYSEVDQCIQKYKPDCVLNAAAMVAGITENRSRPYEFYVYNEILSLHILHACLMQKVPYLLSCSSTCAYPNNASSYPMIEEQIDESPPSIDNLGYGMAKRNTIITTQLANKQYGTNYGVIIPSNLYGPNDRHYGKPSAHYVTSLMHKLVNSENHEIEIGGSGTPLRQFTYLYDVAYAVKLMLDNQDGSVLNCASPENMSILEIAEKAIAVNNLNVKIKLNPDFPDGQYRKDVSSEKLISKYDFKFTPFENGIHVTYEHYKNEYKFS